MEVEDHEVAGTELVEARAEERAARHEALHERAAAAPVLALLAPVVGPDVASVSIAGANHICTFPGCRRSPRMLVFLATALAILLVPGPAVLYVVTRSIEMGRAGGIASVAGITTATAAYVVLATAGLSSLVIASAAAFDVVKYAGAAYLVFLGVRRLLGRGLDEEAEEPVPRTRRRAYSQGFLVNLTNPKMIVFVFALLPQFVDPNASRPWLQTLVLGLSFTVLAFLSDCAYALAAGSLADRMRGTNTIAWVQRWVGGSVLVGLGLLSAAWSPSR